MVPGENTDAITESPMTSGLGWCVCGGLTAVPEAGSECFHTCSSPRRCCWPASGCSISSTRPFLREPTRPAKRPTGERIGRLAEHRAASIDRGGIGRGVRCLVGALAITSLQQVGRCLPHLNEPEDQGHDDDQTAELPRPRASLPARIFVHRISSQMTPGYRRTPLGCARTGWGTAAANDH